MLMATESRVDRSVQAATVATRELLTVKDVSVRLDCHELTVRRLIRRGHLAAVTIGRLVKVPVEELDAYLRRNRYRHDRSMLS
jgi:excisionase family DNA binding protein